MKTKKEQEHLALRIIGYASDKDEFFLNDMSIELKLSSSDRTFIHNNYVAINPNINPNHIFRTVITNINPPSLIELEHHYLVRLLPTALFNYVDHLEVIEARKAATVAKQQSAKAIKISIWSLIVASILGFVQIVIELLK